MEEEKKEEIELNQNEQLQQIIQSADEVVVEEQVVATVASFEYAGFWVRFAAVLVDGLVLIVPSVIVGVIFGKNVGAFAQYILCWSYAIYMLNTKQATLGKMAVGIKVVRLDGGNQTVWKLAAREIPGKILSYILFGMGYVMIAFTEKKQGLHDMIANTVVVYDPVRKRRPWITVMGIVFALIIPILGVMAAIILVSTSNARDKALEKADEARQKAQSIEVQLQQD